MQSVKQESDQQNWLKTVDFSLLENQLLDVELSLAQRFRALFSLKSCKSLQAIEIISRAFHDTSDLLKHELAYVLGQMQDPLAVPILESILSDEDQSLIVRHEAAEALGAIGEMSSLKILSKFALNQQKVLQQTCELAMASIELKQQSIHEKNAMKTSYTSIDPAPPMENFNSIEELESILLNEQVPLFDRYRAMFALRNIGTNEAVHILGKGFQDSSALFRHEIAYVFGQMQMPSSIQYLIPVLENQKEESMVRHEAAEALGSIAHSDCLEILKKFSLDDERIVRESCLVALDMYQYNQSNEFQYASMAVKEQ